MHNAWEWQTIFIDCTDGDKHTKHRNHWRQRRPRPQSQMMHGSFNIHIYIFYCARRIWNSVADPSNYTDNIASSSSSSSVYVIDELNKPTRNKRKKKENWFQCENGTTKSEPLHIVVRALYLDLDMKLVIFDGTSRQSRQNTIHNIDGNIRSKCALYPCVLTRVLTTQPHVRSAKKMDRERESKKISMNCFSGFYCCQIRILLNAFRNRSNSSQRWRLKNVIVSLSLAKEVRLNRAQWLLSISGWVCV